MTKLKINTHSGSQYKAEVTNYNAAEVNEKLNRNDVNTVAFGDIIVSRIDVKSVAPIEEIVEEPKQETVEEHVQDENPVTEQVE